MFLTARRRNRNGSVRSFAAFCLGVPEKSKIFGGGSASSLPHSPKPLGGRMLRLVFAPLSTAGARVSRLVAETRGEHSLRDGPRLLARFAPRLLSRSRFYGAFIGSFAHKGTQSACLLLLLRSPFPLREEDGLKLLFLIYLLTRSAGHRNARTACNSRPIGQFTRRTPQFTRQRRNSPISLTARSASNFTIRS